MRPAYGILNRGAFRMGFPNLPAPGSFDFNPPDLTLQPGALDAGNFNAPAANGGAPDGGVPAQEPQGQVPLRTQYVLPTEESAPPEAAPEEKEEAPVESGGPTTVGWLAIGAGAAIGIGLIVAALG